MGGGEAVNSLKNFLFGQNYIGKVVPGAKGSGVGRVHVFTPLTVIPGGSVEEGD